MYKIIVVLFTLFSSMVFSSGEDSFSKKIEEMQKRGEEIFRSEAIGIWKCTYIGESNLDKSALLVVSESEIALYPSNDIISFNVYEINGLPKNNQYMVAQTERWHVTRNYSDGDSIELKFKYRGNVLSVIRSNSAQMEIMNLVCQKTEK
ncbi:hypothetical protein [Salinivibrio sp. ES.052]|uniref:hypothetical protein n=1 Tax=Salinivibrio sp. ES.052 TaxID=1882823 RepID=UPI0009292578|nr:hypothetical protein [Salinivibrio sp. ES.052]SIO06734.1 hypothetical protein SAMN05444724_1905 [Salinivibrio sp. ES.052]SIO40763.1 hypothetical protein SAMN05444724_3234 [Salinivibrio sp. ES.052]